MRKYAALLSHVCGERGLGAGRGVLPEDERFDSCWGCGNVTLHSRWWKQLLAQGLD